MESFPDKIEKLELEGELRLELGLGLQRQVLLRLRPAVPVRLWNMDGPNSLRNFQVVSFFWLLPF